MLRRTFLQTLTLPDSLLALPQWPPPTEAPLKRCSGTCRQNKACSEFYTDQGVCKQCTHETRKLTRRAAAQGEDKWLAEVKKADPKAYQCVAKNFQKHMAANKVQDNFCVATWKRRIVARRDLRGSKRRKMMWEKEFYDFKATTAEGNMTKEEAEKKWKELEQTPGIKTDNSGPYGYKRLSVVIGDFDSDYEDLGEEDEVEATVSQRRNADQNALNGMVQRAMSGAGEAVFENERAERRQAFARSASINLDDSGEGGALASGAMSQFDVRNAAVAKGKGLGKGAAAAATQGQPDDEMQDDTQPQDDGQGQDDAAGDGSAADGAGPPTWPPTTPSKKGKDF